MKVFFWGFLGLNFSTDKNFCKTNSQDSNILFKYGSSVCFNLLLTSGAALSDITSNECIAGNGQIPERNDTGEYIKE